MAVRFQRLPASLMALGREAQLWLNALANKRAAVSADATASAVAPGAAYSQTQVAQIVTDLNAAVASLNDLKAKLRAAGMMDQ